MSKILPKIFIANIYSHPKIMIINPWEYSGSTILIKMINIASAKFQKVLENPVKISWQVLTACKFTLSVKLYQGMITTSKCF